MTRRIATFLFSTCTVGLIAASRMSAGPIVVNESSDTYGKYSLLEPGVVYLPGGSTIGPGSSIDVTINLAGTAETTNQYSDPWNLYAGIDGVSPDVAPGQQVFTITYQLFENGAAVSNPFGFTMDNSFSFPVNNIYGWGTSAPIGVTFNTIELSVTNTSATESLTDVDADIEAVAVQGPPRTVPDAADTLPLLLSAAAGLVLLRRRDRRRLRRRFA